ncbi:MAG: hypothetical protein ACOYXT_11055 [Bacteroidota bacterium]
MITIAKWIVILFGVFLVGVGVLMLLKPKRARAILQKAGSTNFINYAEITIRMIPAISLILYSDFSKYPLPFYLLGWFMLVSSIILYFVPRKMHHAFSLKSADILQPKYFQFISPFSVLFGLAVIYNAF